MHPHSSASCLPIGEAFPSFSVTGTCYSSTVNGLSEFALVFPQG